IERLVLLGIVRDSGGGTDIDFATVGVFLSQDAAEQDGLACAVRPDDADVFTEPDSEVHVTQYIIGVAVERVGKGFGEMLNVEHFVRAALGRVEVESDGATYEFRAFDAFHFVEAFLHGTCASHEFFILSRAPTHQAADGKFEALNFTSLNFIHLLLAQRSEERRVGKECRSRWWPY